VVPSSWPGHAICGDHSDHTFCNFLIRQEVSEPLSLYGNYKIARSDMVTCDSRHSFGILARPPKTAILFGSVNLAAIL
jgi:hypothetical protein